MKVYITEKPSVARELVKCLPGPVEKKQGYFETGDGVVTWALGHVLEQIGPEEYDEKLKAWSFDTLPILPQEWKLKVSPSCAAQFKVIAKLLKQATEIVHAGDPDREGQLLIDEVLEYLKIKRPVHRLLLNALDETSIRRALADLRDNQDFFGLQQSALARSRADWLIGMNFSRAYTLAARRAGHDVTLRVGRVKSPTLALVVRREDEILHFRPVQHYAIKAAFQGGSGVFAALWKAREEQAGLDSEGRLVDKAVAVALLEQMQAGRNAPGTVEVETKRKEEARPACRFHFQRCRWRRAASTGIVRSRY